MFIIKVFFKKCYSENNKKLFELIFTNLSKLISNNYKVEFYVINKEKIKTLKSDIILPMFYINKSENSECTKYNGIKNIRKFINNLRNNEEKNEYKQKDTNQNKLYNQIFANKKNYQLLFADDDENSGKCKLIKKKKI